MCSHYLLDVADIGSNLASGHTEASQKLTQDMYFIKSPSDGFGPTGYVNSLI